MVQKVPAILKRQISKGKDLSSALIGMIHGTKMKCQKPRSIQRLNTLLRNIEIQKCITYTYCHVQHMHIYIDIQHNPKYNTIGVVTCILYL